jgi:RNA polymerase sigma-70 factor (ECF subfamily)
MSEHSPPEREARFVGLFEATYVDLVRFAQRRVPEAQAEDIVAEALLVAWRRSDDAELVARQVESATLMAASFASC